MVASFFASQQPGYGFSSPSALFAAGEQGAWYDPSDLSTMFQDFVGATPVTASGQTVGLILDKSQGLARGPEKRADGFTVSTGTGVASYDNVTGVGTVERIDGSNFSNVVFSGIESDTFYEIDFEYVSGTAPGISLRSNVGVDSLVTLTVGQRLTVRLRVTTADLRVSANFSAAPNTANFRIYSVKKLFGNHANQATAVARPIYQVDGNGKAYLSFDGIDDFLISKAITPGSDKVQAFTGLRKLSDAAAGAAFEFSNNAAQSRVSLGVPYLASSTARYFAVFGGSSLVAASTSLPMYDAPQTSVITLLGDIPADQAALYVNSTLVSSVTGDQGSGGYVANNLYIGRRGGSTLPFNGRIYGLILRFGGNLSAYQIRAAENYVNQKTGAW